MTIQWYEQYVFLALLPLGLFLILAPAVHWFFWMRPNPMTDQHRIQKIPHLPKDLKRDFIYSCISMLMFGIVIGAMLTPAGRQHSAVYTDPGQYGWPWLMGSFLMLMVFHDINFYVVHRLMHHPQLFRHVHALHHQTKVPSPFSAFGVHPVEFALVTGYLVPVLYLIPVHFMVVESFAFTAMVISLHSHLNVEIFPKTWAQHRWMRHFVSSTCHNTHHRHYQYNFGYFFNTWDLLFKTRKEP